MQPEAGKKGREGVIVILSTAKAIGAHLYTCKFRDSMCAQLLGCNTVKSTFPFLSGLSTLLCAGERIASYMWQKMLGI